MLILAVIAFVALVCWLARRQTTVRVRTCCSAAQWPPVDLVDDPAYAEDVAKGT